MQRRSKNITERQPHVIQAYVIQAYIIQALWHTSIKLYRLMYSFPRGPTLNARHRI